MLCRAAPFAVSQFVQPFRAVSTTPVLRCGVLAVIDWAHGGVVTAEPAVRALCDRMATRGPDGQGWASAKEGKFTWALGHQRLAIMDPHPSGDQPFVCDDYALIGNGEIYNYKSLYESLGITPQVGVAPTVSESDTEVIKHVYREHGVDCVSKLDGMFAFVLVDRQKETFLVARDSIGIKPLYQGERADGTLMFASELKCLVDQCDSIELFPAGHYYTPETGLQRFYAPSWDDDAAEPWDHVTPELLRSKLSDAVAKRMMSDVEWGLFLSGGVDSCIVATLIKEHLPPGTTLPSFCVGMEGSPDIVAARSIAETMGFDHTERLFTAEEACAIIPSVVYHLETYETELIRSAIPNYFLAEAASKRVRMVLTGEGSDELFGGYVYFRDAPSQAMFQGELRRIFNHLGLVNLQRADRMTMAHGLEARVPFLDTDFVAHAMRLDPRHKLIGDGPRQREKAFLRNMFAGEIREEILWRQKAMQCEGVGEGWVAQLQRFCREQVSDEQMAAAADMFPINTPQTHEEMYYRLLFNKSYPGLDKFVHAWEGGMRAGGAAWKSSAYTREGLADVSALTHGLQSGAVGM